MFSLTSPPENGFVGFRGMNVCMTVPKPPFKPPVGFRLGGALISPCHPRQTTRRGPFAGGCSRHLAEFRLEPVEENTATRVPERARVGTGPRFREMRASLGPPTDRPTDVCT